MSAPYARERPSRHHTVREGRSVVSVGCRSLVTFSAGEQGSSVGSGRVSKEMIARAASSTAPVTLPQQAYGPKPIDWFDSPRPVWAWVSWKNRPAERVPCVAVGANDRVVILDVPCHGGHWSTVVWRNAVTVRTA